MRQRRMKMCIVGFYKEVDLIMDVRDWFKGFKGAPTPFDLFFVNCVWLRE